MKPKWNGALPASSDSGTEAIAQCNGGGENERQIPLPEDQQSFFIYERMLLLLANRFRGGDAELLF